MLKALGSRLRSLLAGDRHDNTPALDAAAVEKLQLTFKSRFYSFRQLLAANTKTLESMAEIERALQGSEPFSFSFVQKACGTTSINVFNMIQHMENIAPGKYTALRSAFTTIQSRIDALLHQKKELSDRRLVIPLDIISSDMEDVVGGKMANLGDIKNRLRMRVPPGFVVTAAAHELFMNTGGLQKEVDRLFQVAGSDLDRNLDLVSSQIRQLIIATEVPAPIIQAVEKAYQELQQHYTGPRLRLAVRSSAHGEDAENSSFAGQYRSELNVDFSQFFHVYKQVLASKYSPQAIAYKINKGFRDEDIAMCVGCLAMVDAVAGGVVYTRNPLDRQDDKLYINSTWGLPKAVVDGDTLCDLFVVARDEALSIVQKEVRIKDVQVVCYESDGCIRTETARELVDQPSLSDHKIRELADAAIQIEDYYEAPQDIEWAICADGSIYLLQSRPLLQMESGPAAEELDLEQFADALLFEGGINASPGTSAGQVFKVAKQVDILQFPDKAILVVEQALPTWAPLVARAAAVISERGGFAGHLANVAREFGVPALFGVTGACNLVENGTPITVTADLGRIYRGDIAPLLEWKRPNPTPMKGSPIYELLQQASRHIVPLSLVDPESRDFQPQNCTTFHDITRFIHEKSVVEMFNFGKDHHFSERSSKQLHYRVPMNWWILNLDDGFIQEVQGKYVKLDNIASIPMLAFWEGFVAIPWDGPPAMDGGGMTSILFRSTMNTALVTGSQSKYADRNYFMISKNFCTLSSRLGYHFSTMEAMVSERSMENYVGFKFKGGAADFDRCLGRLRFIQEILERYGFRAGINGDILDARLEGRRMDYMLDRLKILGYLTLHTRQLDMIMGNRSQVNYYMNKLSDDIDRILAGQHACAT